MVEANINQPILEENIPVKEYGVKRDVRVFKHRQFEIIEVNKDTVDNIKRAVENADSNINNGTVLSDILLGLSTTFFGGFIGFLPHIFEMVSLNQLTPIVFFYFSLLLISVILFAIYWHFQRKSYITSTALIDAIKRETESISRNYVFPDNDFPGISPSVSFQKTQENE